MTPFYNAGIRLYSAAAHLVALRSDKVKRMLAGQHRTITRLRVFRQRMAPDGFDVWFHAASLGEFEQARPLIERLLAERPGYKDTCKFLFALRLRRTLPLRSSRGRSLYAIRSARKSQGIH